MTRIRELPIDADTLHKLNAQRRLLAVEHRDVDRLYREPTPTRFTRGLTKEARRRIGIDPEPINFGDFIVALAVIGVIGAAIVKWWIG